MAVALPVLAADAWTKAAVAGSYELGVKEEGRFISIVHLQNPGIQSTLHVLGILPGGVKLPIAFFVFAGVAASLIVFMFATEARYAWIPAGLAFGGVLGNTLDLVGHGYATDFIYFESIDASANVADLAIVTATVAFLVWTFVKVRRIGRRQVTGIDGGLPSREAS